MDPTEIGRLSTLGEDTLVSKYLTLAGTVIVIWDHLLTLSDEVKYMWKRDKSWAFYLFVLSRYSILLFKVWQTITLLWPGYTQEVCNRTVKLEGYYFVLVVTLGHISLTMRVYALTEASKYILICFGSLVITSLATGLWLVSVPSAAAVQMPKVALDPFRACLFSASETAEWAYRSQIAFADLVTFVCIVIFVLKLRADHGHSRMTLLMRTMLQNSFLYFFVMMWFHIAMALSTFFARPSILSFPPIAIVVLVPVMTSRLVISLRKAVDTSLVQAWDGDHFSAIERSEHEMLNFAPPPTSPRGPITCRDSRMGIWNSPHV